VREVVLSKSGVIVRSKQKNVIGNDQMNWAETEILESFIAGAYPGCSSRLHLPVTHDKAAIASDSDYGRTKHLRIILQYSFSLKDLDALYAVR
jgi:hypothetical protein